MMPGSYFEPYPYSDYSSSAGVAYFSDQTRFLAEACQLLETLQTNLRAETRRPSQGDEIEYVPHR